MTLNKLRVINPKCSDHISFLCSIIISLHHYDLLPHPERFSKIKRYINNYELCSNSLEGFEYCNPSISLTVYDEFHYRLVILILFRHFHYNLKFLSFVDGCTMFLFIYMYLWFL